MRALSTSECLTISGGEDDNFDLNDVFTMIENQEAKLLLLGTLLSLGTGYFGAALTYAHHGFAYSIAGGAAGIVAGSYLLPLTFVVTYAMVDQSYRFFGFVK